MNETKTFKGASTLKKSHMKTLNGAGTFNPFHSTVPFFHIMSLENF